MRVKRDFEKIYAAQADPWQIGEAAAPRYQLYLEMLRAYLPKSKGSILDIGCGFGAMLHHFAVDFDVLHGVEISAQAVEKGRRRYPDIHFINASAADTGCWRAQLAEKSDCIILSDVLYYLKDADKEKCLAGVRQQLRDTRSIAFIASWCPGGKYMTFEEHAYLVNRHFTVVQKYWLNTGHAVFVCRQKRRLAAVTIDYETWHGPTMEYPIDWERDIIQNSELLMAAAERAGVRLTFMAELGEYFWLKENRPELCRKIRDQLQDAVRRGHDVQMHLHPNWLPDLRPGYKDGTFSWNWSLSACHDYPGDLAMLIRRCKTELEELLRPVSSDYRVTSFRAGAYQVQPFSRLYDALAENGILCDSSVYRGGFNGERGYDFRSCKSAHQPYNPSREDPQIEEAGELLEIPIFTFEDAQRWFLDNDEAGRMNKRWNEYQCQAQGLTLRQFRWYTRCRPALKGPLLRVFRHFRPALFTLPAFDSEFSGHETYVMIGHSKGIHDYEAIENQLSALAENKTVEFKTLTELLRLYQESTDCARTGRPPPTAVRQDSSLELAARVMAEIYGALKPGASAAPERPDEILKSGFALCLGYNMVLTDRLRKLGFRVRTATLHARDMPNGSGKHQWDSHEIALVTVDGKEIIFDATTNSIIPHRIKDVLKNPHVAVKKTNPDERYRKRCYEHYDTAFFYRRVVYYQIREYYRVSEQGEGAAKKLKRLIRNVLFSILPGLWLHLNYHRKGRVVSERHA